MTDNQFSTDRLTLLNHFRNLSMLSSSLDSLQKGIVAAIPERLSHYNWVGFYMLDPNDPETLVLGPFVGAPTPHVRIPVTEGICGAAVATGKTVIVDDVGSDPRYLSCAIETKSEIVAPIFVNGKIIGEIDIDSHHSAAFTDADRIFVEEISRLVGAYVEDHPAKFSGGESKLA